MTNNNCSVIICCSCAKMDKKASEAFSLLFPGEPAPSIVKGRDRVFKLAQSIGNEHIKALSKLSGKFAYYVELEDGKVVKEYNLVTGARTA